MFARDQEANSIPPCSWLKIQGKVRIVHHRRYSSMQYHRCHKHKQQCDLSGGVLRTRVNWALEVDFLKKIRISCRKIVFSLNLHRLSKVKGHFNLGLLNPGLFNPNLGLKSPGLRSLGLKCSWLRSPGLSKIGHNSRKQSVKLT